MNSDASLIKFSDVKNWV